MSRTRSVVALGVVAAALAVLPVVTSCGGGTSGGSAASVPMADRGDAADGVAAEPAPAAPSAAAGGVERSAVVQGKAGTGTSGNAAAVPNPTVKLVKTADLVIEVRTLRTAAAQVRSVAESTGGTVSSETTSFAATGPVPTRTASSGGTADKPATPVQPGESVLVLRVPVASLEQVVDRVAGIGKELSRTSSALDVTADLADLGSRVKTQQASVERVRALLAKAQSLQDVVLLESELSRRESDLEALQARQASLAGRADLSTVTVTLRTPDVAPPEAEEDNGFLKGLKQGWHAVVESTAVVLTVLGALLPLLVVGAVLGLPLWWLVRRRAARRPAQAAPPRGVPAVRYPQAPAPAAPAPAGAAPAPKAPADPGHGPADRPADRPADPKP